MERTDAFNVRSLPVGFLETVEMYPLDFEEFCVASGAVPDSLDELRSCYDKRVAVPEYLHRKFLDLFFKYLLIGGMPEAVQRYLETNDLGAVRRVQQSIFYLYENDISKYLEEKSSARHVKTIYEAMPGQLSKENKRFIFADLSESLRFAHLETAFDWLIHAGVALPVYRASEPQFPLSFSKNQGSFKFFMNDIGLLTSRLMGSVSLDILNRKADINFGAVFENAAAQELKAHGHDLYFYNSKGLGEVDFLLEDRQGDIRLVEIKSGRHYRGHTAINKLLAASNYSFKDALVFCEGSIEQAGQISYLPIYMIGYLQN